MFRSGKWVSALLLVCLYCVNANSAAYFEENSKNCNKTRYALNQLYEIFEPRDWIEELKYLENALKNNDLYENNRTNNKRTILEGTHYCQTCFNASNAAFCNHYCGLEIHVLKNKTYFETTTTNKFFISEIKNKTTVNENLNMTAIIDIKNKTFALDTLNNTYNLMLMIFDKNATTNNDKVAKIALTPVIALNKTRSPQALNRTAFNEICARENKNRTALLFNMEKEMANEVKTIQFQNKQYSVAKTEPTAFNKFVGNVATPCAAIFMYAIMNPQVCSKL